MTDIADAPQAPPILHPITFTDVKAALAEGWRDFRAAPGFGLFFSAFYVLGGVIILSQLSVLDQSWWILPIAIGFPMLGPFAAVGLYEVSRRLERAEPLDWAAVISVIFRQKDRQIPSMVLFVIMVFLFWIYAAHLVFALFFGLKPMTNVSGSAEILYSLDGFIMLSVGTLVGAALSSLLFATTVIGLPLLLEREIDIITAMINSVKLVRANPGPMVVWGLFTAISLFLAMLPLFLGLFLALPVLGHANWRLYRRAVSFPD